MATVGAEYVISTIQGDDAIHIVNQGGAVLGGLDPNGAVLGASGAAAANVGSVGQIIRSTVASGAAVALTTATPANVTSISVTAGDWDVWAAIDFNLAATTNLTQLIASMSLTSATLSTQPGGAGLGPDPNDQWSQAAAVNNGLIVLFPLTTLLVSAATTLYLVAQATFTVAGISAYGTLTARRRR